MLRTGPLFTLLIVLLSASSYAGTPLKPYKGIYHTTYDMGFTIDVKAERTLKQDDDGNWTLDFRAEKWFAKISQTSKFQLSDSGLIQPLLYRRYQQVFGEEKDKSVSFDWSKMRVTNNIAEKPWKMSVEEGTQDLLSYQLKLRYDLLNNPEQTEFRYQVADGGKIKHYLFRVVGKEILDTPMGKLNTVKVESLRRSKKDVEHLIWMASDWDNLLLRVEPVRKKHKEKPVVLLEARLDGQKVTGL
ncbi:DUF3108 domain-containing protein [Oceanospirillum sediminis]|uniref:DUF3108 domain-containing protein n=1 Tax=Oceanospirillum sediminis TaxID=2760088 RepID=A0A839ITN2_9GAMM|nr:DUF3108 domain-containing protein [Oceanospirillum sediminis]MBB1488040.1 DUF3108 domain-containing protein [Oceanospirillum sediminis]